MIKDICYKAFLDGAETAIDLTYADALESLRGKPCFLCGKPSTCLIDLELTAKECSNLGVPCEENRVYLFGLCLECAQQAKTVEGENAIEGRVRENISRTFVIRH